MLISNGKIPKIYLRLTNIVSEHREFFITGKIGASIHTFDVLDISMCAAGTKSSIGNKYNGRTGWLLGIVDVAVW